MSRLEELIKELPLEFHQEVEDFVELLLLKKECKPIGVLKLDWHGALRHLRDKYTSVELQHKAMECWGD
jgi:hypothetical protein